MTPEKCPFDEALEDFNALMAKADHSSSAIYFKSPQCLMRSTVETIRTALIAARDAGKATAEQQDEATLIEGFHRS